MHVSCLDKVTILAKKKKKKFLKRNYMAAVSL